jgi:hypothetical protein
MSTSEGTSTRKEPVRLPVLSETALLAIIAFGFLMLHILIGVLLLPGRSDPSTPQQQPRVSFSD